LYAAIPPVTPTTTLATPVVYRCPVRGPGRKPASLACRNARKLVTCAL
jgi:hypothetical protein